MEIRWKNIAILLGIILALVLLLNSWGEVKKLSEMPLKEENSGLVLVTLVGMVLIAMLGIVKLLRRK